MDTHYWFINDPQLNWWRLKINLHYRPKQLSERLGIALPADPD